jgi:hypothetical protein
LGERQIPSKRASSTLFDGNYFGTARSHVRPATSVKTFVLAPLFWLVFAETIAVNALIPGWAPDEPLCFPEWLCRF